MKEGYWVTRSYQAGCVFEKSKYFIPGTRPTGKDRRRERKTIKKQEQNESSSVKALARLMNANFHAGDPFAGLDYSQAGMERLYAWIRKQGADPETLEETKLRDLLWEAAAHELDLCLRRVKYILKKQGVELKAIYCTSDMDGETGECVRVHHHMLINPEALPAFKQAWKKMGGVDYKGLYEHQIDRTPIAEYIIRQVRRIPDAKKYRSTRNLTRPRPKDRIALSDAEIRIPRGAVLIYRAASGKGQPQYIRYHLHKENTQNTYEPVTGTGQPRPDGQIPDTSQGGGMP